MKYPKSIQSFPTMRSFVMAAGLAVLLSSCGGAGDTGLEALKAKRDSLKTAKTEIATMLSQLELSIAEMDTSLDKRIAVISTMALETSRFDHFFEVQGTVETDRNAQIFPEAPGRITSIKVKEGQRVTKGQLLMTIDSRVLQNQIDEVKARYDLAEIVFRKQEKLWKQKIGSELQYLEAENNRDALKNSLEALQAQLDMYTVNAPFAGVVDEIYPKEGEMAGASGPAFRLINLDQVYIKADVSERYLGKINVGDSVQIHFPSMSRTISTEISRIGNFINPNNRTFKITLNIENGDNVLKPNLLAEINIKDFSADSTIVIPSNLILETPNGEEFVMVAEQQEGVTRIGTKTITSGMRYEGNSHVLAGLSGVEKLVTKGARSVKVGEEVLVKN